MTFKKASMDSHKDATACYSCYVEEVHDVLFELHRSQDNHLLHLLLCQKVRAGCVMIVVLYLYTGNESVMIIKQT